MTYQWLTNEELMQRNGVEIGYNPDTLKPFKFYDFFMGDCYGIFGMTSVGKSILAGNIATMLAQHRPLIVLDYRGDYKNLKFVNMKNKEHIYHSIPDLVYIPKFGFKLQDFTNPYDWEMLGLTKNGADVCASKARQTDYHKNNFDLFRQMIEEIPSYKGEKGEIWRSTKQSILSKLNMIKRAFIGDDNSLDITYKNIEEINYTGVPYYISDWKYFVQKHRHICLNMNADTAPAKAQLMAGKILNEIKSIVRETKHVLLIEEAHEICPAVIVDSDVNVPYSRIEILDYMKELHKDGVKMILISQYPHQLHEHAMDEIKRFFIGKLQNVKGHNYLDEMFRMSMALHFNFIENYREFWHFSPIYSQKSIFVPYDSFTYYDRRK